MADKPLESDNNALLNKKDHLKSIPIELKHSVVEICEKYPLLYKGEQSWKLEGVWEETVANALNEMKTKHNFDLTYDDFKRILNSIQRNLKAKLSRGSNFEHVFEYKLLELIQEGTIGGNECYGTGLLEEQVIDVADKYPLLTKHLSTLQKFELNRVWQETVAKGLNEMKTKYNVDMSYEDFQKTFNKARICLQNKLEKGGECNSDYEHKLQKLLQKGKELKISDLCKNKNTNIDRMLMKKYVVHVADVYPLLVKPLSHAQKLRIGDILDDTIGLGLNLLKTNYNVDITYGEFKHVFNLVKNSFKKKSSCGHSCYDYEIKIKEVCDKANAMNIDDLCTPNEENLIDGSAKSDRISKLIQKQIEIQNFQAETNEDGEVIGYDFKPQEFLSINVDNLNETASTISNQLNDVDMLEVMINDSTDGETLSTRNDEDQILSISDDEDEILSVRNDVRSISSPVEDANEINDSDDDSIEIDGYDGDDDNYEDYNNDNADDLSQTTETFSTKSDSVKCTDKDNRRKISNSPTLKTGSELPKLKRCYVRLKRLHFQSKKSKISNIIVSDSTMSSNEDFENALFGDSMDMTEENDLNELSTDELKKRCLIENIKKVRVQISYYKNKLKLLSEAK